MREIKFRAWDRDLDGWVYSNIYGIGSFFIGYEDGQYETEPEQFTGLYDATKWEDLKESEREAWTRSGNMPSEWKGREIYEGDRVSVFGGVGTIAIVEFCMGTFVFRWDSGMASPIYMTKQMEVIGNIHENSPTSV